MINFPLLSSEDVEIKVKQVTKTGALMLLYKTARVDARILDEVVGPLNWTNEYREVKGNLYCRVGIREDTSQEFVYKEDCGIESGQDDGNEKKAEASDAFKRCCSKLGIGRELYTSPQIWASVSTVERNGKWYLEDPYAKYIVTHIAYNEETRVITELEICNAKSNIKVFSWKMPTTGAMMKKMVNTLAPETPLEAPISPLKGDGGAESTIPFTEEKKSLESLITAIGAIAKHIKSAEGTLDSYKKIIKEVTGKDSFKCNTATESDYDTIYNIYAQLIKSGYTE